MAQQQELRAELTGSEQSDGTVGEGLMVALEMVRPGQDLPGKTKQCYAGRLALRWSYACREYIETPTDPAALFQCAGDNRISCFSDDILARNSLTLTSLALPGLFASLTKEACQ